MPGHTLGPLNERFRLTLAFNGDSLCVYVNGNLRLTQRDVQPDMNLTIAALGESADATIYRAAYRTLSDSERVDLGE